MQTLLCNVVWSTKQFFNIFQQSDQQNQGYGNMGYGQQNMQAGMQGNMPNMGYQQGMNQPAQGWMGGQMMGNYGYGNQNFPTAYPQSYGNQSFGKNYSSNVSTILW